MFTFEKSMMIERPVEEVFAYVTDPANDTHWRDVELSELSSAGPLGVGSTIRNVSKFMGREMDFTAEVTVYDPPYQFCTQVASGPVTFGACQSFEDQDGGTLVTMSGEAEVGGFFKVAEGMVAKQVDNMMEGDFNRLKAVLEG